MSITDPGFPNLELSSVAMTYTQDPDCCDGSVCQALKLETENGGVGMEDAFLVIATERWAIDFDGIDEFADLLKRFVATVRGGRVKAKDEDTSS